MRANELRPKKTLRVRVFPEPVQIILTIPMGDAAKLGAKGLKMSRVYERILPPDKLAVFGTTSDTEVFDCDSLWFHVTAEITLLGLAFKYVPHFPLGACLGGRLRTSLNSSADISRSNIRP
jgi:hypothetical protein